MRILLLILLFLIGLSVAAALYFRFVPMPSDDWHVEPADVTAPTTPNYELRAGDTAVMLPSPVSEVAARLHEIARAEGATLLAGDLETGHATYVVRSRLMGYPDAISLSLSPEGAGTRVEIFSRSRFGYSDMGVNAARVARWIAAATP